MFSFDVVVVNQLSANHSSVTTVASPFGGGALEAEGRGRGLLRVPCCVLTSVWFKHQDANQHS